MNLNTIRTIGIVSSAILATGAISIIFKILNAEDEALKITFIALLASGLSLDIYLRLLKKYPAEI